jgi:hypothetical protein
MRPLSASELLAAWERGLGRSSVERALTLLCAAGATDTPEEAAGWPIGRRDRGLLALRERTFGPRLTSRSVCSACGEALEIAFTVAEIAGDLAPGADAPDGPGDGPAPSEHEWSGYGYRVELRLPDSRDLAELGRHDEPLESSRRRLLERCVVAAHRDGRRVPAARLPKRVARAIGERLAAIDPHADIEVSSVCPGCGEGWSAPFDVVEFFWTEIDAWARRLVRDVHTLARAYGWSEDEILALSPLRRQCYLDLAREGAWS